MIGEERMTGFLKRHIGEPSIRMSSVTSLNSLTSFKRTNVELLFNNILEEYQRYGLIVPNKIWNFDKTVQVRS